MVLAVTFIAAESSSTAIGNCPSRIHASLPFPLMNLISLSAFATEKRELGNERPDDLHFLKKMI
jgi:hypothetical protein